MRRDPTDHIGDSLATIACTGAANNYIDLVFTTKDSGNFMGKHYYAPIGICLKINESPDEL